MSPVSIVWFRRDLRLQDNRALSAALGSGRPVKAVFVRDPQENPGGASRWYLHHSLLSLQRNLARLGIPLYCRMAEAPPLLANWAAKRSIETVYCNRVVEPEAMQQEAAVREMLQGSGVDFQLFADDCLLPPESVHKQNGEPYRVFTPFWRRCVELLSANGVADRLSPSPEAHADRIAADDQEVARLELLDAHPWHEKLGRHWRPGETEASALLQTFLQSVVPDYDLGRDFPARPATSRLSAALHFGEISAARIYDECQLMLAHETDANAGKSIRRFLSELGWREFARHVLQVFPESVEKSLNPGFDLPQVWEPDADQTRLRAWQTGRTGIPLVDAGMRELWETGWMHNRVRMVVASFLTKNLGVHWREGANWFCDTLVDADLASNTLGWQWVAGCGVDAAPYYRIFNPELQAKKFDPEQKYIRRWSGDDYQVPPIVDLKQSRVRALERYKTISAR